VENPGHLTDALILGNLKAVEQAFLLDSSILYLCPIG
jgi:hypothetical protein